MQSPALVKSIVKDIAHLKALGMYPVIVHGGGPEISKVCKKMGVEPKFVNGLRATDEETLEIVQMVLMGKVNKKLVSLLNQEKVCAVGLSGNDGNFLMAKQINKELGFVGKIEKVNPEIIFTLLEAGFIPVIAPIATSLKAQDYNVNADTVAASVASSLKASHLVFLTDVGGVFENIDDPLTKIDDMKSSEISNWVERGKLKGGMIPKMKGALSAVQKGVEKVHILDGTCPNSLFLHFQGSTTQGTTIHV